MRLAWIAAGGPEQLPPDDPMTGGKGGGKKGGKKGGKGKGKGGKGGPRTCFECGAENHIAAAYPVRIVRFAAGGPERLDKQDDPMKGGKGNDKGNGKKDWRGCSLNGYTWIPTGPQWKAASATAGVPSPSPKQWSNPMQPGPGKGMQWIQPNCGTIMMLSDAPPAGYAFHAP